MSHTARLCRRRWARWGRGLADFIFGFTLTGLAHLLIGIFGIAAWSARGLRMLFRRAQARAKAHQEGNEGGSRTPQPGRQETEEAIEALVSLGMPRRVAEARVEAEIAEHGPLPLEQLLPKALSRGQR